MHHTASVFKKVTEIIYSSHDLLSVFEQSPNLIVNDYDIADVLKYHLNFIHYLDYVGGEKQSSD